MTLPLMDMTRPAGRRAFGRLLDRLRGTASFASDAGRIVASIIDDVRRKGDTAVARCMRKWTDPAFSAGRIRVTPARIEAAQRQLSAPLRRALAKSIRQVRQYQKHVMPRPVQPITIDGAQLGLRFTPVDSVGLLVPGGRAAYPSSLIMLAVPALVAGVPAERISVVTPPPTRRAGEPAGDVSNLVLAAAGMLGIRRVYRIGGAQAVAALVLGTKAVERVDLVAGPGNVYVQLAKAQLAGVIGTDNGFYGPSEILTLADVGADPACVAADLIAQAEHDPGKCFLVSWSRSVIEKIRQEIGRQRPGRQRLAAIDAALANESAAILVRDKQQAVEVANLIAAEHVNLAVKDPRGWLAKVRHGGEFFLSDRTPVAAGDYLAGPSHCLPTGATARFTSGVSVYTFLKRSGTLWYRRGMSAGTIDAIAALAQAEGLEAHAASARARRSK